MKIAAVVLAIILAFVVGRMGGAGEHDHNHASHDGEDSDSIEYVCPMHPQIRQKEFGTCPICYMDLVPVEAGGGDGDLPVVTLSEGAQRLAGVRTETIESMSLSRKIDVFGRVGTAESAEVDLTAWVGGRIERLFVSAVGEQVKKGQLLARIYSPDLLVAQRALLQASQSLERAEQDGATHRIRAAQAAFDASRNELRLLGVSAQQLSTLLKEEKPREHVDIYATASGTIRRRHVSEGDYLKTGDRLLSLVGLNTVWVQLEIFERDIAYIKSGMPVTIELSSHADFNVDGRIEFVDPVVDEQKRIVRARVVVTNEHGLLRPGAYVRATIDAAVDDSSNLVSVPASSVLWTGRRSFVYRYDRTWSTPGYEAVQVLLGPKVDDRYIVHEGVSFGDEIVTHGAFRLDASLQIKGGTSMMGGDADGHTHHASDADLPAVEVSPDGVEFAPPVQPSQLPDNVWYCDMGTVHWAQGDEKDATCPLCNMRLTHKPGSHESEGQGGEHVH